MNLKDQRALALGAVRSQLRAYSIDPVTVSSGDAHAVLDDLARQCSELVASLWYRSASSQQLELFYREWEAWKQEFLSWASVSPGQLLAVKGQTGRR